MRRLLATAVVLALSLVGATAAARAATLRGTPGADRLLGTGVRDTITALGGNDLLAGRGGIDTLSAGPGDDRIAVQADGSGDSVLCGAGHDVVTAELFDRIVSRGESFWSAVYEPFMTRDLTRADVRVVVTAGLQQTRGNYKMLVEFFNMAPQDYKRFLNFLRKHDCQLPFKEYRQ